jgi:N-acetylneuraminic acid mutarotase
MIIWGGQDTVSSRTNTGAYYDPATNSWSATSMTGVPAVRSLHTAIWTEGNSLMIVWGGLGNTGAPINTGGRLDVSTNSWTSTSTTGAAIARSYHTATYQSSKMYVWGGVNASNVETNTGGRYNF